MSTKRILFILYNWATVILWALLLFWFSSIGTDSISKDYSKTLEYFTYFFGFGMLLLLTFRAHLSTFRLTVERLAFSRSKKEKQEDSEFVLIIETLLLANSILISSIIMIGSMYILNLETTREVNSYLLAANLLGILGFALIAYGWPLITTFELNIAKKLNSR